MKFSIYNRNTSICGTPSSLSFRNAVVKNIDILTRPLYSTRIYTRNSFHRKFPRFSPIFIFRASIRHSNGKLSQIKKSFVVNVLSGSHSQASNGDLDICLLELHPLSDSSHYALYLLRSSRYLNRTSNNDNSNNSTMNVTQNEKLQYVRKTYLAR